MKIVSVGFGCGLRESPVGEENQLTSLKGLGCLKSQLPQPTSSGGFHQIDFRGVSVRQDISSFFLSLFFVFYKLRSLSIFFHLINWSQQDSEHQGLKSLVVSSNQLTSLEGLDVRYLKWDELGLTPILKKRTHCDLTQKTIHKLVIIRCCKL